MALSLGIFFSSSPKLTAEEGSSKNRQTNLNRKNRQSDQGEKPAVEQHHRDIDHREGGIKDGGKGLTSKKIPDLLQFGHPGSQLAHRATVEITKGETQQVVDHLSTETLINTVGGFCKQKRLQTPQNPLQNRDHHKGDTQHLQRVQAALGDHLVDDHLNQQRVGKGEQLNHKTGRQHLNQNAAVTLQSWPEPTGTKRLIWCCIGALHQQKLNPLREGLFQLLRRKGEHALIGRRQPQPSLIAGHHQSKAPLPREHRRNLQSGSGNSRHPGGHHMQAKAGGQLATELKIGLQPTADVVLKHLLDRITPEGQLHQLRQHLETSQNFLNCPLGLDQAQAVDHIALRTEAAHWGQDFRVLNGGIHDDRAKAGVRRLYGVNGQPRGRQRHQPKRKRLTSGKIRRRTNGLSDHQVTPGTGYEKALPSGQGRIHRGRIRRTTFSDLQGIR